LGNPFTSIAEMEQKIIDSIERVSASIFQGRNLRLQFSRVMYVGAGFGPRAQIPEKCQMDERVWRAGLSEVVYNFFCEQELKRDQ
jgi:hypothetical protein